MTRAELIEALAKKFPYQNPITVDNSVREIFEIMIETLSAGDRIEIRGFGSFEVRIHEPRHRRSLLARFACFLFPLFMIFCNLDNFL